MCYLNKVNKMTGFCLKIFVSVSLNAYEVAVFPKKGILLESLELDKSLEKDSKHHLLFDDMKTLLKQFGCFKTTLMSEMNLKV